MNKNIFRNELAMIKPYVPGKSVEAVKNEFGITDIVKLASNENPLGPSPKAVEMIVKEAGGINIYPDPAAMVLREKLAEKFNLSYENFVIGNGGEQLLQIIANTFINAGDEAVMADTTFDMYGTSVSFLGGVPVKLPLKEYKHDFEKFVESITDKTKLIYVCNPNNPTGNIMAKKEVEYLVGNTPEDVVLVFDEAYYDYAIVNEEYADTVEVLRKRSNTIILRTFSKVAGIAAVRVGYVITSKEIAAEMGKIKGAFNVNKLALAAAVGALEDKGHIERTVKLNYESLGMMEDYFEKKGLEYIKSNANFVFVNADMDSQDVFEKLMQKGVIIRPGFLWKWNSWIRVSTGTLEQTKRFLDCFDEI